MNEPATVVLVHGAWHGAWCWHKVVPALEAQDVPVVTIDLPGHGDDTGPLTDLAGDAAALRRVLDTIDGDAVVCGHSYGGAVVSEGAAGHPVARHLAFLTAFPLAVGESCTSLAAVDVGPDAGESLLGPAIVFHDDDTVTLDPAAVMPALFHDCSPGDVDFATARLGPQAKAELFGVATRAAWETIPSTYAVCTEDRSVLPALQRVLARRATHAVEWPTSHSPFFSRPDLVVGLLAGLAHPLARSQVPHPAGSARLPASNREDR
jgi:pimeloyl-ACP methyl ester carboxylesterase